ncbi:MAG TPA: adenylate/guanylate cyclase domain-containing protein [Chthonomonadales bacterium]|nr:adenylate/guanylate cyclase domain-containing protein [Chthonomonadales bacterium]
MTPPRGVVTLMFTDVEGSTRGWEAYGDRFAAALQRHEAIIRAAVREHSGYLVKGAGDAFMVAFPDAISALRCAERALADLESENRTGAEFREVGGLRVRIGVHTGEPQCRDRDYFGPPVNRASRICDAGHGGMALVSDTAWLHASRELPCGFSFHDLGSHRLKDLGDPEHLRALQSPRIPAPPNRPLRTLDSLPHNFPAQLTTFVGRSRELAELGDLLVQPGARILTLTGVGGCGKTRLALQAAADIRDEFPDGVWFIDLAGVRSAEGLAPAIALALGVEMPAGADPLVRVADFLRELRALLILDNFEQVVDAADQVVTLAHRCPGIRCLVTSREVLRVTGEREVVVEPLEVREDDPDESEALHLFVERCAAARPGFELAPDQVPLALQICRRLDGIPLAIELAAARVRAMSVREVLTRLSVSLDFLASARRDLPERQRSLRGALEWSYELLSYEERAFFALLAVFRGGWTLQAAEAVSESVSALELLCSLRDKSLVRITESRGQTRYAMLATIRDFAAARLEAGGGASAARLRHARHFLAVASELASALGSAGTAARRAMEGFSADIDNLRAAMDSFEEAGDDEALVAFARSLFGFLRSRGLYDECERRLARAEEAARRCHDRRGLARLLNQHGLAAWDRFELARAQQFFHASFAISDELRDWDVLLPTLINLGNVQWGGGDVAGAKATWERALMLVGEQGHDGHRAVLTMCLGIAAMDMGERERAEALLEEALEAHRRRGDAVGEAMALCNLSDLRARQGLPAEALDAARASLRLSVEGGERRNAALARVRVARLVDDAGEAQSMAQEGLRAARELGDRACELAAEHTLGLLAASQGDHAGAMVHYRAAFRVAALTASALSAADVLTDGARSLAHTGRSADALLAAAAAESQYEARGLAGADTARMAVESVQAGVDLEQRRAVIAEARQLGALRVAARLAASE